MRASSKNSCRVRVIGSGVAAGDVRRGQPAYLVQGAGISILLDAGSGTVRALLENGVNPSAVDAFCFSHFHPDHIADLVPLLLHCKVDEKPRRKPLILAGPVGLRDFLGHLTRAYAGSFLPRRFTLRVRELNDGDAIRLGIWTIRGFRVPHFQKSLGYRLSLGSGKMSGRSVVYTGDTEYGPNVVRMARGADLFLAEASFPQNRKVDWHLTPLLAGRLAREAGVKHLVLMHLYPPALRARPKNEARREFSGKLSLARDGMEFVL